MTKLKDLGILPPYKEPDDLRLSDLTRGYNSALRQSGEIDVGLNEKKLSKLLDELHYDSPYLAKLINDNFKDLVKVSGK